MNNDIVTFADVLRHLKEFERLLQAQQARLDVWDEAEVLHRVETLAVDVPSLRSELTLLRSQVSELQRRRLRAGLGPGGDWHTAWRETSLPRHLKVDEALIRAMGETGECLRQPLVDRLYGCGAINTRYASRSEAQKPFKRLLQWEIIDRVTARREGVGGRPVGFFRLTARGRHAHRLQCQRRFGEGRGDGEYDAARCEPVTSEYDLLLARHKSPEHVWLNLQAGQIMRYWAQRVNLYPREGEIRGVGLFAPDIEVLLHGGDQLYVECERGRWKASVARQRKWEIYHQMTHGHFYLFVPNKPTQEATCKEIRRWAREAKVNVHLHLCNVFVWHRECKTDERIEGDPPWTTEEEYRYAQPSLFQPRLQNQR